MNKFEINDLSLSYSDGTESLKQVSLHIPAHSITVLFGPAGGGKSTLLRVLNRLNDLADVVHISGQVQIFDQAGSAVDILDPKMDVIALRRRVAMVFARPIVLPMSIRENLTYGLKLAGIRSQARLQAAVETSLQQAALWEEVRDRLDAPAVALSGGQQQRLCLARSLALEPEVILLDLNMPRMGGIEALRHIRSNALTKLLPVVVLTSSDEEKDMIASYECGVNSYIRKPVDFTQFVDAVRHLSLYWMVLNQHPHRP